MHNSNRCRVRDYIAMPDIIVLDKEDFPSGTISVSLRCPTYQNLKTARQHYPAPQSQNDRQPSYTMEDLLVASMLEEVNGKKPMTKGDTVERLYDFEIADKQFLIAFFLERFYISNEKAKDSRAKADKFKLDYKPSYTVYKKDFPSEGKVVSFRRPNVGVQMDIDRRWQGSSVNGCTMEEMLMASCIETVDGEVIEKPKDIVSFMDEWQIMDVQYLNLLFVNLFSMDDNTEGEKARKLAKDKTPAEKASEAAKKKKSVASQEKEVAKNSETTTTQDKST